MERLRTIMRRVRSLLLTTFAVACILAAVLVGLARLGMPLVSHYQPELENWLSERVGQPVELATVAGRWTARGPVVSLGDMRVIDPASGADALRIASAEMYFDLVDWALPGRRPNRFRILGGEWGVRRLADGRLQIEGLGASGGAAAGERGDLGLLFRQGTIELHDTEVYFVDEISGLTNRVDGIDLVLNNTGDRHLLQVTVPSPADGEGQLELRLEAMGEPGEGRVDQVLVYARAQELDLAQWSPGLGILGARLNGGRLDAELWGEMRGGRLSGLIGDIALADLRLSALQAVDIHSSTERPLAVEPRYALDSLRARVNWQLEDQQWQLGLSDLEVARNERQWPTSDLVVRGGGAKAQKTLALGADFLRVQDLTDLALVSDRLPADLRGRLYQAAPSGDLREVRLSLRTNANQRPLLAGGFSFDQLSALSDGTIPGFSGLSGQLTGYHETVHLQLDSERLLLNLPQVFRHTLPPLSVAGDVHAQRREEGWLVATPRLDVSSSGFRAQSRFQAEFDGTAPFIDASVDVRDGDMRAAADFLPDAQWDAKLVNWLRTALVSGRVTSAGALVRGDLDDWPFAEGEGTFISRIHAEDGVFEFSPDWPPLRGANATIEVVGNELRVNGRGGSLLDGEILRASAVIPNLREAVLSVSGRARGRVADFRQVIQQSPLENMLAQYFADLELSGDGVLDLGLRIPMTGADRHISVDGKVDLSEARVVHRSWRSPFEQVAGDILFSERGFRTQDVSARMNGQPVAVELEVGPEFAPTGLTLMALVSGEFEPAEILAGYPTLMPVAAVASGRSSWTAMLSSPEAAGDGGRRQTHMTLTSNLVGTGIDLPAPLGKTADVELPLSLSMKFPFEGGDVQLVYGDRGTAEARANADGSITSGVLHFGAGLPGPLPEQGVRIEGHLAALDAAGWVAMAGAIGQADAGRASALLNSMELSVDELSIMERSFPNAQLSLSRSDMHWHAEVNAEGLKGQVRLPATDAASESVVAEFSELTWPAMEPAVDTEGKPITLDPRQLPNLHLFVEQLDLYGVDLGEALLQTYPTRDGLHVETLEANSERMQVRAKGDWVMTDEGPVSEFAINLISESLGDMLSSFGFIDAVHGGQTIARLQAEWPGAPVDFKLANLAGELQVSVSNGRIPEAELGAGRILGLLSLNAIPRRLALDFSDLFESGLGFDSIEGTFALRRGEAWTDDLRIRGPAMDILVTGRTGLIKQEYDQVMVVVPKVGVTFPIVGALAAGPGGAAAGFLLSNIFSSAIDDMSRFQYTVTGPWEEPDIELRGAVAANGGGPPTGSR